MCIKADISLADLLWGLSEARHTENLGESSLEIRCSLWHVASTTVSLKLLLLIPFNVGLLPAAEWVPLLEAYFVMHLKGVLRSMACASTSHWDSKGNISCMVPMAPPLEKEGDKPGWNPREQTEREVTGMQEWINFKQNPTFAIPCLPCLGLYPRNVPWFMWSADHFPSLPWNHKV